MMKKKHIKIGENSFDFLPSKIKLVSVGRMITESADINKITFTGSVPTGKAILAKSGEFVRPVTLELGGKSPLIIFDDFDVDQAVQGALQANFYSQGQVCSNGARVYVQEKIYDEFKGLGS